MKLSNYILLGHVRVRRQHNAVNLVHHLVIGAWKIMIEGNKTHLKVRQAAHGFLLALIILFCSTINFKGTV